MTDSEQVPWGKGEKYPHEGSEIDLKLYAYKQSKEVFLWRRTFCIMGQRVNLDSKLKPLGVGVAKASSKERLVIWIRPETEWSSHGQVESKVKFTGGPNTLMLKN